MADPFSVIAGTAGLLDVCFRIFTYLKETQVGAARIEDDIAALMREIEGLIAVNQSIKTVFETELKPGPEPFAADARVEGLWRNIGNNLQDCQTLVQRLEALVRGIIGKGGPKVVGKIDGFKKQMRKQSKNEDFHQVRLQLANHQSALQLLLSALNL